MLEKTTTPFSAIDRGPSRVAQMIVGASGVSFVLVALALLFAPRWFFENIGFFPPYNRHYEGDLSAFLFSIGAGLVYAARNPTKHCPLIAVAALGSALHVFNHIFDSVTQFFAPEHWLTDIVPLVISALLLLVEWNQARGI